MCTRVVFLAVVVRILKAFKKTSKFKTKFCLLLLSFVISFLKKMERLSKKLSLQQGRFFLSFSVSFLQISVRVKICHSVRNKMK